MKQMGRLTVIAIMVIGLLVIGIVPAFGYTVYYSSGNRYSTSGNGFYNPGATVIRYPNQYQYYMSGNLYKSPTSVQPSNPVALPAPSPVTPPVPSTGLSGEETKMVNLVNQERTKQGVRPLAVNAVLTSLARKKSQDMVANNYFSHISPTYGSPFDMMQSAGISYRTAGENIAGAATTESAHQSLMNSPGHRANILNSSFTQIGIGIAPGSIYGNIFTQMFIGQ